MTTAGRPLFGEQQRFMLFLIAPAALLLGLFQVVPIVIGANASFRNWALYNPKKDWIGLDHYRAVITDPAFLEVVLPNTFVFMVLSVAGSLRSISAVISGVMAIAMASAACARRGSLATSPSRSRASRVRKVCMTRPNSPKRAFQPVRKTTIIRPRKATHVPLPR